MSRIQILNCCIDNYDMDQTISSIEEYILDRKLCQHVVVNAAKLVEMKSDLKLRDIINSCDIVNADGMPVVWASRILGKPLPCRVAGVDLFQELIGVCAAKGYRPFFFGAREEVVVKVVEEFRRKHPRLEVAGYRNGYYSPDEEQAIAEQIRDSHADMLFVGFSSPMKEKFLNKWMPTMQVPFCMGVGGSFDIVAGRTKRAPLWMQNAGLEWFYRVLQEPKRMWKRYATTNPVFIWMVCSEFVRFRVLGRERSDSCSVKG